MNNALYAGTFDPWTNGHHDVLQTSCRLFDHVTVAILTNPGKTPMFTVEERRRMIAFATAADDEIDDNAVDVVVETGKLAVDVARDGWAKWMIRGLRLTMEYEQELGACLVNAKLNDEIQTIYIPSRQENLHVSSTAVRTLIGFGRLEKVRDFVPPGVHEAIEEILAQRGAV